MESETIILENTETTETVGQDSNYANPHYISIGLAGVFLIGILIGLFVFHVFSERWHT